MFESWRNWRRKRAAASIAVSRAQWEQAEHGMPFLGHLDVRERRRLRQLAKEFIAEKRWSAASGLELRADMQISIALHTCLLILHLGLDWYGDWVGIVVYPGDFMVPRRTLDQDGVMHEYEDRLLGQSWKRGPVLLSWFERGASPSGISVVIHEFAHKLDMLNGPADGAPPLHKGMSRAMWHGAFSAAYRDLCERVDQGKEVALDPYAATHPAEFFAVASEDFFLDPRNLRAVYPDVFAQLQLFYRQDPCAAC